MTNNMWARNQFVGTAQEFTSRAEYMCIEIQNRFYQETGAVVHVYPTRSDITMCTFEARAVFGHITHNHNPVWIALPTMCTQDLKTDKAYQRILDAFIREVRTTGIEQSLKNHCCYDADEAESGYYPFGVKSSPIFQAFCSTRAQRDSIYCPGPTNSQKPSEES